MVKSKLPGKTWFCKDAFPAPCGGYALACSSLREVAGGILREEEGKESYNAHHCFKAFACLNVLVTMTRYLRLTKVVGMAVDTEVEKAERRDSGNYRQSGDSY